VPDFKTNFANQTMAKETTGEEETSPAVAADAATMVSLDIPSALSQDEWDDLVASIRQGSEYTLEDCQLELLEAARYDDIDVVKAILLVYPELIFFRDASHQNTALHMAAANGHTHIAQLLLHVYGNLATSTSNINVPNDSGNTPLHWAAMNGHTKVVNLLLQAPSASTTTTPTQPIVDVLQKNAFGRSALTEGFTSQNSDTVEALLAHESASEERLMQTSSNANNGKYNAEGTNATESSSVTHDFIFRVPSSESLNSAKTVIKVRELAMARTEDDTILCNSSGEDNTMNPEHDTTGLGVWAASLVTASWMAQQQRLEPQLFASKVVLELGAGCGVPGLVLAAAASHTAGTPLGDEEPYPAQIEGTLANGQMLTRPSKIYLTDFNGTTIDNMQYNLELNSFSKQRSDADWIESRHMNWQDPTTWPDERIDCLIGSDLIYQREMVPLLTQTIRGLLTKPNGVFWYVAPNTGRQGQDEFLANMEQDFHIQTEKASEELLANPLASQDEDLLFLHFNEFRSLTFLLHKFTWKQG